MSEISELARRRGFFVPSNEAYGGTAGFYSYGPVGAAMKSNIEETWRDRFVFQEGNMEIEAPTVMPEEVFEASGHLEGFDDMIIECPECGESLRADHIVEDSTGIEEAESFSTEQVEALFEEHDLRCPECGVSLAGEEVEEFNLMFETSIGPGSSDPGYLRPETAQGIFVEFPRWKEYARNQLPFGVTQIGKAYRNEISPRKGLVRVREFTQAELEFFLDPEEDEPELGEVEEVELTLYPMEEQGKDGGSEIVTTVGDALEKDIIDSEWVAYFMGVAAQWYRRIGIDMERFRFRQHLSDELSHYASDCWDAETEIDGDWIEVTGFAYRGCYDLNKHQEHSGEDFTVFKEFDEPRVVEETKVEPDMGYLGPEYGDRAGRIVEKLEELAEDKPELFEEENVEVSVDGEKITVPAEKAGFTREEVEKNGERILPETVEPSFGIGRILYTLVAHNLEEDQVNGEERQVLQLPPEIAPLEAAVFPLMDRDGMGEKAQEVAGQLRSEGFSVKHDDSGAIGRRYRRQDEVGTPFCVTVDHDTLEDGTVTIRDRDSTEQIRVNLENLAQLLGKLLEGAELSEIKKEKG